MALTTGLNYLFAWISGAGIKPLTMLFATIDAIVIPAILAPLALKLLRWGVYLRERNRQLETEVTERQRAEEAAQHRASQLQMISDLAVECAAAPPDADLSSLIAEKLRDLTGAIAVSFSTYDEHERALTVRYVSISGRVPVSYTHLTLPTTPYV